MKKKLFLILVSLSVLCTIVFAGSSVSGHVVETVHIHVSTGIHFRTNQPVNNPDGCASASWYKVATGGPYEKEVLSLLLTAKASGDKVSFYIDGCAGSYPKVVYLNIHD